MIDRPEPCNRISDKRLRFDLGYDFRGEDLVQSGWLTLRKCVGKGTASSEIVLADSSCPKRSEFVIASRPEAIMQIGHRFRIMDHGLDFLGVERLRTLLDETLGDFIKVRA